MKTTRNKSNAFSPIKENVKPLQKQSPSKLNMKKADFKDVLNYLRQNHIDLPSHLQSPLSNPQNLQLKLIDCSKDNQSAQVKNLKVKLNDTQFQLKKIEEDFAQFKRTTKNERQKQQKKWEQTFLKLKEDSKQNIQDFDYIRQKVKSQHQSEIIKLRKKHEAQLYQQCQKLKNQNLAKIDSITKVKNRQIQQIIKNKDSQFKELENKCKKDLQQTQNIHKQQIRKIQLNNKVKNQQKDKKFQSLYIAIQSQKKTQQKMHQKTKIQANKQKQQLTNDLCYQRNVKKQLQSDLQAKIKQVKTLKSQISDLQITIEVNQQKHRKNMLGAQQQKANEINSIHENYENKIKALLQGQIQQCQKYDTIIKKFQESLKAKQVLHQSQLQQLSRLFDARLSKKQDLQEIKRLQNIILRRDEQIKKLSRQLKYCNLEIQNKEQVYNKIFKSATKTRQDKRSLHKDREGSKDSLFRKSQTTDIKLLLKAYNKNFETNPLPK